MSDIIFYDDYMWVVPKPPLIAKVKYISTVFTTETWLILLIIIVFTTVLYNFGIKYERRHKHNMSLIKAFLNLLSTTASISAHFAPRSTFTRLIFISYALYSILVTSYFSGKLRSVLTNPPHEHGVSTMKELADSSFTPFTYQSVKNDLLDLNYTSAKKMGVKGETYRPINGFSVLDYLVKYQNVTIDLYQSKLDLNPYFKKKVKIVSGQFLMDMEGVMVFRKHYPLLGRLNEIIMRIHEAGLTKKWVADMMSIRFEGTDIFHSLNIEHYYAAFALLAIGILFAFILFTFELFTMK